MIVCVCQNRYECAIFSTIEIEFFYNFVYRLSHSTNWGKISSKYLKFHAMIARLPHKTRKSIGTIDQILSIGDYKNIFVVDDLFDGPTPIWIKFLPKALSKNIKFHAYKIPAFTIKLDPKKRYTNSSQIFERCMQLRSRDRHLRHINISKTVPAAGSDWNMFTLKTSFFRSRSKKRSATGNNNKKKNALPPSKRALK